MNLHLDMIGVVTPNIKKMTTFYEEVLGMKATFKMDEYVEFEQPGVRFALTTSDIMHQTTGHKSFSETKKGQTIELAFKVATPKDVDTEYAALIEKGATAIKDAENKPWGQRAAFFADPDGNIHEIFADIPS